MKLSVAFVAGIICAGSAMAASSFDVPLQRRGGFDIDLSDLRFKLVVGHIAKTTSKFSRAMENYKRNTGHEHPLLAKSHEKRNEDDDSASTATIDLKDVSDELEWIGPISIGGQKSFIDFDTGSGDLIINPGAYSPKKSNTSQETNESFTAAYADGTRGDGKIYRDTIHLGKIAAHNVSVGRVDENIVKPPEEGGNQGVAGLSFPSITAFDSKGKHTSVVEALSNHSSSKPIFQFSLKAGDGSTLHIGDVDKSKIDGDVTYVDVNPRLGFWLTEAKIKGKVISAIIDSGTTVIIGPTEEVSEVFNRIGGIETFNHEGTLYGAYDCDRDLKLSLKIGGKDFTIPKKIQSWGKTNDGRCVLAVNGARSIPFHAWVVGGTFFQDRSIIFDAEENRLGFADAK